MICHALRHSRQLADCPAPRPGRATLWYPSTGASRGNRAASAVVCSSESGVAGYRCQYCYNTQFSTTGKLARHILSEHRSFVSDTEPQCPYCGESSRNRSALADHIRSGCKQVGQCSIPSVLRRRLSHEALAADPKYPLLAKVRAGVLQLLNGLLEKQ